VEPFDEGYFIGLLVGEGHFGGDGKQAQITLRMHVRHEGTFRWLERTFPQGKLYGPYLHGGRNYYQWMARGKFLKDVVVPLIEGHLDRLDQHVAKRFLAMCARYRIGSAAPSDQQDEARKPSEI
jgi:hypothetical protein